MTGRWRNADPEETRGRLVAAGEQLFLRRGYPGVTGGDVAGEAGLDPAAFAAHFANTEALLFAIVLPGLEECNATCARCMESGGSGLETIDALCRAFVRHARDHPGSMRLLRYVELYASAGNGQVKEVDRLVNANFAMIRKAIVQGMIEGTVRRDLDPGEMAVFAIATCYGIASPDLGWRWLLDAREAPQDIVVEDFHRFLLPALTGRPGQGTGGMLNLYSRRRTLL